MHLLSRRNEQDDVYQYECCFTESADSIRTSMPTICVVARLVRARKGGRLFAPAPRRRLSRGSHPYACLRSIAAVAFHALGLIL